MNIFQIFRKLYEVYPAERYIKTTKLYICVCVLFICVLIHKLNKTRVFEQKSKQNEGNAKFRVLQLLIEFILRFIL